MAKIKYDLSDVEDVADGVHAPVGIYRGKVRSVEGPKPSSNGNPMLEVVFDLTHDASGKKLDETFMPLWYYPILEHDHPFVQARLKEFLLAFGLKPKGILDTDKIVGKSVQLKLGSDTDQDGDYRPRIKKVMGMASVDEPEEGEEPEEEPEPEEPEAEEEELDLDDLDRAALKALIKEEGLEIKVFKSTTDDQLREAIAEAMGAAEEEEPEEPEAEEAEEPEGEDGDGYDDMSIADLKAELKERELATNGAKKVLIARLRKDDSDEPF